MNVTRNVINDLLPAYFAGEASDDSRRFVEDYFRQDPEFERMAREGAQRLESLAHIAPLSPALAQEKSALNRVRQLIRNQRRLFGIALSLTLNAVLIGFSFDISSGNAGVTTRVHWLLLPFQRDLVLGLGTVAAVLWAAYFIRAPRARA